MNQALIIFCKNLDYGRVKTRLASTMGNDIAMAVYRELLQYTHSITREMAVPKFVFYSDYLVENDIWQTGYFEKQTQQGSDLGERMENAFALVFEKGYESVIVIGTDCFEISTPLIAEAFARLQTRDIVIGPATDGGYYLIGMNTLYHSLFRNIHWSTGTVLHETLAMVNELHLSYSLLPLLNDIDEEKDLTIIKKGPYDKHHHSNI